MSQPTGSFGSSARRAAWLGALLALLVAGAAWGHGAKRGTNAHDRLNLVKATPAPRYGRAAASAGLGGPLVPDPKHREWLRRRDGGGFFMCGPGDPEGFLYRGALRPDGGRDGDQMLLLEKLGRSGANCLYLMAVRSHGGDGDETQNPFVDHDPRRGLNDALLDQWETWFDAMDRYGIVIFFILYDDSARIWNTGDQVGPAEEAFVRSLVGRFRHHPLLIWCIAEEYEERLSPARVKALAAVVREADPVHPIAVHKLNGLRFDELVDDPNIDQFAIQYNVGTAAALHDGVVRAWRNAAGRYSLNLAEAADWGTGAEARRKAWACAMGGALVMVLGMDIATTPLADLEDCGRLVAFFGSVDLARMAPHDELAAGDTRYVFAAPGQSYIAYTPAADDGLGVRGLPEGDYRLRWFDCASGREVVQSPVTAHGGIAIWQPPPALGPEIALHITRLPE